MQVTAESPLVDVKQSARADEHPRRADRPAAARPRLHHARHAGARRQPEAKLGGLSIDGASAGENRYIIDGIETTNLQSGLSGKNLIADFVEEVQVKSSGYTAEFGGATGGVINAVTKSGTNDFHGSALSTSRAATLDGANRPTLRLEPDQLEQSPSTSTYPKDDRQPRRAGLRARRPDLQGQALWFFGAYQPALTSIEPRRSTATAATRRRASNQEQKRPVAVHHGEPDRADRQQHAHARGLQQQLEQDRRPAAGADRPDPAGTNYTKAIDDVPELDPRRATSTGSSRRSCSSASAAATTRRTSTTRTCRRSRASRLQQHRTTSASSTCRPACSTAPASRAS